MIAFLVALIFVLALVIALAIYIRRAPDPAAPQDVDVRLYEIRKRMEVALYRLEARSEADRVRRELHQALHQHGRRR